MRHCEECLPAVGRKWRSNLEFLERGCQALRHGHHAVQGFGFVLILMRTDLSVWLFQFIKDAFRFPGAFKFRV